MLPPMNTTIPMTPSTNWTPMTALTAPGPHLRPLLARNSVHIVVQKRTMLPARVRLPLAVWIKITLLINYRAGFSLKFTFWSIELIFFGIVCC